MAQRDNVIEFDKEKKIPETRPRAHFKRALFSCFIIITILVVIYLAMPISRLGVVYFDGLQVLNRSDLITLVELGDDDFFIGIRLTEIKERIEEHPVVNSATVNRAGINRLRITVVEYEVGACTIIGSDLFYILIDGTMLYENENMRVNCTEMMIHGVSETEVEAGIVSLFVRQLMRVDEQIVNSIQSIYYAPLYGDVYRFSLLMFDGNVVNITTHTMHEYLNRYRDLLEVLILNGFEHGQTGVFNLDVGGTFVPHE